MLRNHGAAGVKYCAQSFVGPCSSSNASPSCKKHQGLAYYCFQTDLNMNGNQTDWKGAVGCLSLHIFTYNKQRKVAD